MHSVLSKFYLYSHLSSGSPKLPYRVYQVSDPDHRHQAKRLHAEAYLYKKFVKDHHIDDKGYISKEADPHQLHAEYFVACIDDGGDEKVKVTAREIVATKKGYSSFPILESAGIYPKNLAMIKKFRPNEIVEISGLAKAPGTPTIATFLVYRAMWQHSKKSGHKVILMACSPSLYNRLRRNIAGAIEQVGPPADYPGEPVIPCMVNVEIAEDILEHHSKSKRPVKSLIYKMVLNFFRHEPGGR